MGGGKEEKKWQIIYLQSDERSAKRLKQKLSQKESPIKHILSKKLSAQC
jgi:hypothetical protein